MAIIGNNKSLFSDDVDEVYRLSTDSSDEYDPRMKEYADTAEDKSVFSGAMTNTLVAEGGDAFVKHTNSAGGDTKFGIAQRYNPEIDVKNLTEDQARDIAYDKYWKKPKIDLLPNDSIKAHVFDAFFLAGTHGIKAFQAALKEAGADISPDGYIGEDTAKATQVALDKVGEKVLHRMIAENRLKEFEKVKGKNLENYNNHIKGWTNRALKMFELYGDK